MRRVGHTFRSRDLVGGHVAVDLVNTVTARNAAPVDWLDDYERLVEWAAVSGGFDRRALRTLKAMASAEPRAGALALRHTQQLREALHDVLTAMIRADTPSPAALDCLARHWREAFKHARLDVSGGRGHLRLDVESSRLEYLNHDVALRALVLLETLPLERTRVCPGPHCGWLFIDRSRGGQRRWCDMATCGNAAKSRRHYERKRRTRR
jgi:predicted RNA-binding Zn ribbon-like protein